jgi:gluconate kinase
MKHFMIAALLLSGFAGLYCPESEPKKLLKVKKGKQLQESEWWKLASSLGTPWMPFFVNTKKEK